LMLTHQFREFGDGRVWTDPIDALVHRVFDFHGRPPLLKFAYQPRFPHPFDYTTDRVLWHGPSGSPLVYQLGVDRDQAASIAPRISRRKLRRGGIKWQRTGRKANPADRAGFQ